MIEEIVGHPECSWQLHQGPSLRLIRALVLGSSGCSSLWGLGWSRSKAQGLVGLASRVSAVFFEPSL